jgi:hypothetical protein
MSFLTKPIVVKGEPSSFALVKSQLILVPKIASDSFFADTTNWKRISIQFKNAQGQEEVLVFDGTESLPTASFDVTEKARADYEITRIIIKDLDDGTLVIKRSDLSSALLTQLDVSFQAVVVEPPAPIAGPSIEVTQDSGMSPLVSWSTIALTGSVLYDLYRDSILIATTASTSHLDATATPSTSYEYQVIARSATQTSLASTTNFETLAPPPIAGPLIQVSQASGMSPLISWSTVVLTGSVAYDVYRDSTLIATTADTSYLDINAMASTTYLYKVTARSATQTTLTSTATHLTLAAPLMGPVVMVETTPGMTPYHVRVSWNTPVGLTGEVTYDVYRGTTLITTTDSTVHLDFAAVQFTSYQYKVIARTATQTSLPGIANFVAAAAPPLGAPTSLFVVFDGIANRVSWVSPSPDPTIVFDVYKDNAFLSTTSDIFYLDFMVMPNAPEGTSYEYKVIARTATQTSPPAITQFIPIGF